MANWRNGTSGLDDFNLISLKACIEEELYLVPQYHAYHIFYDFTVGCCTHGRFEQVTGHGRATMCKLHQHFM
jgi:hypothetical protein